MAFRAAVVLQPECEASHLSLHLDVQGGVLVHQLLHLFLGTLVGCMAFRAAVVLQPECEVSHLSLHLDVQGGVLVHQLLHLFLGTLVGCTELLVLGSPFVSQLHSARDLLLRSLTCGSLLLSAQPSFEQQPLLRSSDSRTRGTPPCLPARPSAPPR